MAVLILSIMATLPDRTSALYHALTSSTLISKLPSTSMAPGTFAWTTDKELSATRVVGGTCWSNGVSKVEAHQFCLY
jgi:hypothetical protein